MFSVDAHRVVGIMNAFISRAVRVDPFDLMLASTAV